MRRVVHLMWFDLLAFRVPLALWGCVLVLEGALFYSGPIDAPTLPELGRVNVTLGLAMVRMLASVVIVALLVHADPTVGTTAFWRSRPIARPVLLASKLISAALWLVALPGLVTAVVLFVLGANLPDASAGGLVISYEQAVLVLMALALAVVTKDLVQYIVAAVMGLGLTAILESTLWPEALAKWPAIRDFLVLQPTVAFATVAIWLAGFVVVYQYLTLRLRHSVVMLACAVMIATVAPRMGARWTGRTVWPAPAPASLVSPTDIALSVAPDTQAVRDATLFFNSERIPQSIVSFEVALSGEPEAIYIQPAELKSTIEFQDHSAFRWIGRLWTTSLNDGTQRARVDDQPYRGIRRALGYPALYINPSIAGPSRRYRFDVSRIPQKQLERHAGETARLDATVTLLAYQHEMMAKLPLKAGSRTATPGRGALSIESVSRTSQGITVVARETTLVHVFDSFYQSGWRTYALRNAARGSALMGEATGRFRSTFYTTFFADAQVGARVTSFFFAVPDAASGGPLVDDEWLNGAELVCVSARLVGSVTRPLRIDSFVVGEEQKK